MAKSNGKSGRKTGKLVPQPHGGAILDGAASPETHVAGPGRPPSRIREELRGDFDSRKHVLRDIADGVVPLFRERCPDCGYEPEHDESDLPKLIAKPSDRSKALDYMAKYGLGPRSSGYDEDLIDELSEAVGSAVAGLDEAEEVLDEVRERWVKILAERVRNT